MVRDKVHRITFLLLFLNEFTIQNVLFIKLRNIILIKFFNLEWFNITVSLTLWVIQIYSNKNSVRKADKSSRLQANPGVWGLGLRKRAANHSVFRVFKAVRKRVLWRWKNMASNVAYSGWLCQILHIQLNCSAFGVNCAF